MMSSTDALLTDAPLVDLNQQTFTVFLIDDQPIVAEKVRRDLLDDPRIQFHYCSNPTEALKLAEEIQPTVVLLDLVMPEIDGIEAVQIFKSHPLTTDVPIMMLSCQEDGELKAYAFETGANDYLVKMPEKTELVARIVYHSMCYLHQRKQKDALHAMLENQHKMEERIFELMKQSTIDGLTGVGNRRALDSTIEQTWLTSLRCQANMSLIMIDVDHFKCFNDYYGHIAGDDCLKTIAHSLVNELPRATDFLGRYGGEEFAVVLPATDLAGATVVAERLRNKISQLHIANKKSPVSEFVSISAGVSSVIPDRKLKRLNLIKSADSALFEAKQSGRNQVAVGQLLSDSGLSA